MESTGGSAQRPRWSWPGLVTAGLAVLVALVWAVASAPGSSPDDDYHLASIWCAWGREDSGCRVVSDPELPDPMQVSVPDLAIESSRCASFKPEVSGACPYDRADGTREVPTPDDYLMRADNGAYPQGFYRFMRLFVLDSTPTSIVVMRVVSGLICLALMVAAGLVLAHRDRWRMWLYWLVGSVPLGLFIFSSNNPSGIAVAGTAGTFAATVAALRHDSRGGAAWLPALLAAIAAALAVVSRTDAVLFCGLAVLVAVTTSFDFRRTHVARQTRVLLPVLGILILAALDQATSYRGPGTTPPIDREAPTTQNILNVLSFYLGEFPSRLGWLDTGMPSLVWGAQALAIGAILGFGVGGLGLRRALGLGIAASAALSLPIVMLERVGYQVGAWVQPRYMLPVVLIILALVALQGPGPFGSPNTRQLMWVGSLASIAHAVALHVLMRRYITGIDVVEANLNSRVEWWWGVPITPMAVWVVGSLAFAALAILVAAQVHRRGAAGASAGYGPTVRGPAGAPELDLSNRGLEPDGPQARPVEPL